jgi:hypothetical protein
MESVRATLLSERDKRENRRLNVLRVRRTIHDERRFRKEFLTKAEQVIRVLRRIGLIVEDSRKFALTDIGKEVIDRHAKGDLKADAIFVECLLNSKFQTYWLFLRRLHAHPISLPRDQWARIHPLRDYLRKEGFPMDVWSFFIIRDLFYEFGLLNYAVEDDVEKTFPMFALTAAGSDLETFALHSRTPEGSLHYWPIVSPPRFLEMLADVYLSLTEGKWNRIIEILPLREKFSIKYSVPEVEFNELFLTTTRRMVGEFRVIPSVGYVRSRLRGSLTKAVNLPSNSQGLPLTLVRIEPGSS